jgi:vesicle coat complex subunit
MFLLLSHRLGGSLPDTQAVPVMKLFSISLSGRSSSGNPQRGGPKVVEVNPYGIVRRVLIAAVTGNIPDEHRLEAVNLLKQALMGGEEDVRGLAVIGLLELEAPPSAILPALAKALHDPSEMVRRRAARALGDLGPLAAPAVSPLVSALRDPDPSVRMDAAGSLGRIGQDARAAIPALIEFVGDDDARVRTIAGVALRRMGPYAVPPLMKCLARPEPIVRERAAVLLGQIGIYHDAVVQRLLEACSDDEADVRQAAREAIERLQ